MIADRPSLARLAEAIIARGLGAVEVACVAEVQSYDRSRRTAQVRPLVSARLDVDDDGEDDWLDAPVQGDVPVIWPTGGGFSVTWDLAPGDRGILLIRDRSHDEVDAGGASAPVHPRSGRRFSRADAVFLPGYVSPGDQHDAQAVASDAMVLRLPAGGEVRIGGAGATSALALATEVAQRLAAIESVINTLTLPVSGATAGPPDAPLFPDTTTPQDVASSRIYTDD